jgi:hypothetical protein
MSTTDLPSANGAEVDALSVIDALSSKTSSRRLARGVCTVLKTLVSNNVKLSDIDVRAVAMTILALGGAQVDSNVPVYDERNRPVSHMDIVANVGGRSLVVNVKFLAFSDLAAGPEVMTMSDPTKEALGELTASSGAKVSEKFADWSARLEELAHRTEHDAFYLLAAVGHFVVEPHKRIRASKADKDGERGKDKAAAEAAEAGPLRAEVMLKKMTLTEISFFSSVSSNTEAVASMDNLVRAQQALLAGNISPFCTLVGAVLSLFQGDDLKHVRTGTLHGIVTALLACSPRLTVKKNSTSMLSDLSQKRTCTLAIIDRASGATMCTIRARYINVCSLVVPTTRVSSPVVKNLPQHLGRIVHAMDTPTIFQLAIKEKAIEYKAGSQRIVGEVFENIKDKDTEAWIVLGVGTRVIWSSQPVKQGGADSLCRSSSSAGPLKSSSDSD